MITLNISTNNVQNNHTTGENVYLKNPKGFSAMVQDSIESELMEDLKDMSRLTAHPIGQFIQKRNANVEHKY